MFRPNQDESFSTQIRVRPKMSGAKSETLPGEEIYRPNSRYRFQGKNLDPEIRETDTDFLLSIIIFC